jgi:hypothetical protein
MQITKKNEPLQSLIYQCLGENELKNGSLSRFADLFTKECGIPTSRQTVCIWLNKNGVPPEKCGHAERLSRKFARFKRDVISIRKLRPDIFY